MTIKIFQFPLGKFQCTIINDGDIRSGSASRFFGGASRDELAKALAEYGTSIDDFVIPCNCMFVDMGEHRVLVDCGSAGDVWDLDADLGHLFEGLDTIGVSTDSITHVILSHGHFDHIGAIADDNGNPYFPSATYFMAKGEWQRWAIDCGDTELDRSISGKLHAIKDQLHFIESDVDTTILEGVVAIHMPGHTLHHMSVEFESDGEFLICPVDVMDHPIQGQHPTWSPDWEPDREASIASRLKILKRASNKNAIVQVFHFPFPGVGRFVADGDIWQWESLE